MHDKLAVALCISPDENRIEVMEERHLNTAKSIDTSLYEKTSHD